MEAKHEAPPGGYPGGASEKLDGYQGIQGGTLIASDYTRSDANSSSLELICRRCGAFIQWVSPRPAEERQARRDHYRREWMATLPVTEKQRGMLRWLGYQGRPPKNRAEASQAIDSLLKGKGAT